MLSHIHEFEFVTAQTAWENLEFIKQDTRPKLSKNTHVGTVQCTEAVGSHPDKNKHELAPRGISTLQLIILSVRAKKYVRPRCERETPERR